MRANEFLRENGSTVAGSIATTALPLGGPLRRMIPGPAKYKNSAPVIKRKSKNVSR